ncbi:sugar ABC transporter substrate-binding protein [Vibrio sp. WXL210]|uniref:sugar ABC transporter substrate-binding protein n=1 Tax=Vibrio sp. WXL210 TaxID=3450709 RepID=UPI003EC77D0B
MKNKLAVTALLSALATTPFSHALEIAPEPGADLLIWSDSQTLDYMEYAAAEFNSQYNYDVKFQIRTISPFDAPQRLIQDGGTARVGDIVEVAHDTLGSLVMAGALMENLVNADRVNEEFLDSARAGATAEGTVYGFPISIATSVLFYNKELLTETPETFESIMAFAETFNDTRSHKYAMLWDLQNYFESRMFLSMYGGYEFGQGGTDATDIGIAKPEAQKGLAAMKEIHAAMGFNPFDVNNPQVRRGLFAEGKVAAIVDGPWATETHLSADFEVGVVPMPTYEGHHPRPFSTIGLQVVPAFTPYPKAAQLFAQFLTTDEMLKKRFEMSNSIPPVASVMEEIKADADLATLAIIQQADFADAMPSIPEMGFIWSPMINAMTALIVNDRSPEDVTKQALSIINEQIELQY